MSNRDNLRDMTAILAPGKDGYVAAIKLFSIEYKADPTILPTEWLDLSEKQTVIHFGAYLVAHKGFNAEQVYGFANVIGKHSADLDLTVDGKTISARLTSLEGQLEASNLDSAESALLKGETQQGYIDAVLSSIKKLSAVSSVHTLNTAWVLDAQKAIRQLEDLLPVEVVAQYPVNTGSMVTV
jgi:hypothetical protein